MLDAAMVETHVARIARDGYTVVENAIEPDLLEALHADLLRLERELGVKPAHNAFEGRHTVRIYNLLVHGPLYERIPVHEHVLPVVEGVLDAGCLVSSLSSIGIDPGERAQPIHADDQLIPLPKPHVPTVCNTMWALTDFTEANGATRIIPGSHLRDHSPAYGQTYDSVAAEMPRGSVLVWHGSLWHGGGANRTDRRRVGIAMNYCAGWIRQQENQQLGIPREIARRFSPRLRELVGYGVYNALIGHVDKQSPAALLDEAGDHRMVWDYGGGRSAATVRGRRSPADRGRGAAGGRDRAGRGRRGRAGRAGAARAGGRAAALGAARLVGGDPSRRRGAIGVGIAGERAVVAAVPPGNHVAGHRIVARSGDRDAAHDAARLAARRARRATDHRPPRLRVETSGLAQGVPVARDAADERPVVALTVAGAARRERRRHVGRTRFGCRLPRLFSGRHGGRRHEHHGQCHETRPATHRSLPEGCRPLARVCDRRATGRRRPVASARSAARQFGAARRTLGVTPRAAHTFFFMLDEAAPTRDEPNRPFAQKDSMRTLAMIVVVVGLLGAPLVARAACDDPVLAETVRAQIATDCQCTAQTNHGQYVSCVASHVRQAVAAGLPRNCKGAIVRCASRSTCGKKDGFRTCCFASPGTCTGGLCQDGVTACVTGATCPAVTRCRIKSSDAACLAAGGSPGTGSCCDAVCSVPAAP